MLSVDQLCKVLTRLDNRKVPKPDQYDPTSGQSFTEFLNQFEEYCKGSFRGSSKLWVGELGHFLTGDLRAAYDALKVSGDSYQTVKKKLLQWRKDSLCVRTSDSKAKFSKVKPQAHESMRLYAARVEKAYRLAYPHRKIENSSTLREKYLDTIPKAFKRQLSTFRNMNLTMHHKDVEWADILKLASCYDADNAYEQEVDPVFCLASAYPSSKKTDAVTQYQSSFSNNVQPIRQYASSRLPHEHRSRSAVRKIDSPQQRDGNITQARSASAGRFNKLCHYCKRRGHIKNTCWRLNNKCLACGSAEHRIKDCPKCRSLQVSRSNPPYVNSRTDQPLN